MSSILKGPHNPCCVDNAILLELSYSLINSNGETNTKEAIEVCTRCQINGVEVLSVSVHDSSSKPLKADVVAKKPMMTPIKIDNSKRQN